MTQAEIFKILDISRPTYILIEGDFFEKVLLILLEIQSYKIWSLCHFDNIINFDV